MTARNSPYDLSQRPDDAPATPRPSHHLVQTLVLTSAALALTLVGSPALASENQGANAYNANCAFCHQPAGQGLAGQFPRIAGRVNQMATTQPGREFLTAVVLNGLNGPIVVDGVQIKGVMPAFPHLDDATVAAILNYIQKFDQKAKSTPVSAEQVKAARKNSPLASTAVHSLRQALPSSEEVQK